MKKIVSILLLLCNFSIFSQFYYEGASSICSNNIASASSNVLNTAYYVLEGTGGNTSISGSTNGYIKLLKLNNTGQLIDSLVFPRNTSPHRIDWLGDNLLISGYKLNDTVNFRLDIQLYVVDTNFMLIDSLDVGSNYLHTDIKDVEVDDQNMIYILSDHWLGGPISELILYKLNSNLDSINSYNFQSTFGDPSGYSLMVNNDMVKAITSGTLNEHPSGNGLQINILDSAFNYIGYKNLDSINYNPNPFGAHVIGTTAYATHLFISNIKEFVVSRYWIGRSVNIANFKSDNDVVSTFISTSSNVVHDYRQYWSADSSDINGFIQCADNIGNRIYVGGIYDFRPDPWNPYYLNRPTKICVTQLDTMNNIVWEKRFGGDAYYLVSSIIATPDSGVLVMGSKYDSLKMPTPYTLNGFILKIDKNGNMNAPIGVKENPRFIDMKIFPNPVSDYINFESNSIEIKRLEIYSLEGKLLKEEKMNTKKVQINIKGLAEGIYVYRIYLKNNEESVSGKFVVTDK